MLYTLTLNPALDRELTVPAFAFDEVVRASVVRVDWGGKGFNVSRALYSDGKSIWQAEPPAVDARNPIGAGDALVAGLVWGLSHGYSGAELLRWGVACGAAAASLKGTAMGQWSLVESLTGQVPPVPA